jgi:signal transduction histidine kinase
MNARMGLLALVHRRPLPVAGVLAVALAMVEVVVDWVTWIELNEAIVYILPLVLAAMARSRRLLWGLTLLLVGTTFAVYAMQIGPGAFSLDEHFFVNRMLAAVTVVLTAGLLHAWTLALEKLDEQGRSLKEQNERLDAANRELLLCQEEITRQNAELDRRRREAEEASGRKSRLLASVSHDIRSPLQAINLTAEVIRQTAADPGLAARVPGLAQRLQANARAMGDLVADVLDLSALESGRVELHESEFSLTEVLADECRRLLPLAQAKNLALTAGPADPPVWIRADRVKLTRVISNLLTNAIKFTETGGVTVTAGRAPDRGVVVRVRDTGVGMAPGDLDRIFDEFARLQDARRDPAEGWGLGLAICRRLVDLMGGTITVESQPTRGTAFSVFLPATRAVDPGEDGALRSGAEFRAAAGGSARCTS